MRNRISPSQTVKGLAFADYIGTGGSKPRRFNNGSVTATLRDFLLPILLIVSFGFLALRLLLLTVFQGDYYRNLSDSNRIRTSVIHAPRGVIFDRNGLPLVYNTPGFREIQKDKVKLLSRDEALSAIAKDNQNLRVDSLREYPYGEVAAHVVGYIGQITQEEIRTNEFIDYNITDLVGKTGVEREFESKLKGVDGKKLVEVDAAGKQMRVLGQTEPVSGENISLTIDAKLQKAAYEAMQGVAKGALVVTTTNGEILAMVSKPSFDTNLFTMGDHYRAASTSGYLRIEDVLLDTANQPLLNRPIGGVYPPGSTFKLVTAAAGLQDKTIDESYIVEDTGVVRVGEFSFANWFFTQYGKTEGSVNVVAGIKRSNDIFFYKLAELVGVDKLSATARAFGLGKTTGITLGGEASGLVPTQQWKKEEIGESWYLGDTYHYGIGQGYVLTTPLQVNVFTQVIASEGKLYQPKLLKNSPSSPIKKDIVSQKTVGLIREGMIQSCSPSGVAWPLFDFKVKNEKLKVDGRNILEVPIATGSANTKDYRQVRVACKTGTAQHGGEKDLPHAWITLFAPAYNPQIVVTVLKESSGEGSNEAAPIAKKVLEAWFSR